MNIIMNKTAALVASIVLVVVASVLLVIGMLVPVTGNTYEDTPITGEPIFIEHKNSGKSISKQISDYNSIWDDTLIGEVDGVKQDLFSVLTLANTQKDILSTEGPLGIYGGSDEIWAGSTYDKAFLSLAQTAVAGFALFMIAIPVIGWTGFLYSKK